MKVFKVTAPFEIVLSEVSNITLPPQHAKVRLTKTSLSLSDIKIFKGTATGVKYPIVPGRHGVGVITELGEGQAGFAVGQRVAINPVVACNACYACKSGRPYECDNYKSMGITTDGLFKNFAVLPLSNLFQLPPQVKDEEAQFVEHVAMAVKVFNELNVQEGEHIAIIGASILGLILAQLALYHQAVPIVLDAYQERLDAAAALGIYYTINTANTEPKARIIQITGGRMCECAVYLANSNNIIQKAFDYSSSFGRIAILGWENAAESMSGDIKNILDKQLKVTGINNGSKHFSAAINLLAKKEIDVASLMTSDTPFDQIPDLLNSYNENPLFYKKNIIKI